MNRNPSLPTMVVLFVLLSCSAAYAQNEPGQYKVVFGFNGADQARHPEAGRARIKTPLNFRLLLTNKYRLLLGVDHESFLGKEQADGQWAKGTGNVVISIRPQFVAEEAGSGKPTVRATYSITLPVANVSKGLGSGRVDHKFIATIFRRVRRDDANSITSIGGDVGISFQGRQGQDGFKKQGLLNLYVERKLVSSNPDKYILHGEIDMISRADNTPSQIYTTNYLQIEVKKNVKVKVGFLAGITPTYARIGGYASIEFIGPKLWH